MSPLAIAKGVAALAEAGDEVFELVKLGREVVKEADAWINGDGPEPQALAQLPATSKSTLALARLEALAAKSSGGTGGA